MRSQFKGYFSEKPEKTDTLWREATFVFDANVLLNLYRYSDQSRSEFLKLMREIQNRSWLPEQCAHEYLSNRLSVVREQMKAYADTKLKFDDIKNTFAKSKGHPFVSEDSFNELQLVVEKITKELSESGSQQEKNFTEDTIKEEIADIFEGRVGPSYSAEELSTLFEEGERRYAEEVPPGYKDAKKHSNLTRLDQKRSKFGDYVLWRQTIDLAKTEKKDVIFVTDDQKEDWWLRISGKTVSARPELTAEFCHETKKSILFYSPESFLKLAQEKLEFAVSEQTITEIRREHDSRSLEADGLSSSRSRVLDLVAGGSSGPQRKRSPGSHLSAVAAVAEALGISKSDLSQDMLDSTKRNLEAQLEGVRGRIEQLNRSWDEIELDTGGELEDRFLNELDALYVHQADLKVRLADIKRADRSFL